MADRIVLFEDDHELGRQLVQHLRVAGFDPVWRTEGRALAPGELREVALVVLDLMLPGAHGLDILKALRAGSEVPVLVLSARSDTADKVRALRLGADDYMTKPFWPEELIERVRARLRRPTMQRDDALEVGSLRVDLVAREVSVRGCAIELTRAEFDLLAALARRPGVALTRTWLMEHVLEHAQSERTLDVHLSRLRKKLGPDAPIETVWGIGYRLAGGRPS